MNSTDYSEIFEETPIYVLGKIIVMQSLGLPLYLALNLRGSAMYPKGTNVRRRPLQAEVGATLMYSAAFLSLFASLQAS
jgi:hypothetical protein